jgi:hypothetical protein
VRARRIDKDSGGRWEIETDFPLAPGDTVIVGDQWLNVLGAVLSASASGARVVATATGV